MLPDIGATELLVIAVVALIVVGPKDLPVLLRKLGQWMAKLRGMAAEFRASFDEMARQSELDELRREVAAMRQGHFGEQQAALEASEAQISQTFEEIRHELSNDGMAPEPYVEPAPPPPVEPEAPKPAKPRAKAVLKAAPKAAAKTPAPKKVAAKIGAAKTGAKPRTKAARTEA